MTTLRVLSAVLRLAYLVALCAARRDRNGPLAFRPWLVALIIYATVYALGIEYPTTSAVLACASVLVMLQAAAVFEAAWRVLGLLGSPRQRWAVLLSASGMAIVLASAALAGGAVPFRLLPVQFWYFRTIAALAELGILTASLGYVYGKMAFVGVYGEHAAILWVWVAAAAWGHAQAQQMPGQVIVTAVHLACALGWIGFGFRAGSRGTSRALRGPLP